jgi:transposase
MAISTPNLYSVLLDADQRQRLEGITRHGQASAKKIRHAQVLLLSDGNRGGGRLTRDQIAERLDMHVNTVDRIRKRFVLEGEQPALNRKPRAQPPVAPKIDGRIEAHLVAICCSTAPEGRTCWTLQLLADELKKRRFVTSICAETVRKALKKTNCSLGANKAGASPSATCPASSPRWKKSSTSTRARTTRKSH